MKITRVVFMGTPEFAVPALHALHELEAKPFGEVAPRVFQTFRGATSNSRLSLVEVITQPDRPMDRKQILTSSPIKIAAEKFGLSVFQPEKLRDPQAIEHIRALNADIIIVAAYGQIIPKAIIEMPRYGVLNVHASLLPKYRGASPIQAAIKSGDTETGVTIMLIDEQLDHGHILTQGRIPIAHDDTGGSLSRKLSEEGARLLVATLQEWITEKIKPYEQNHAEATLTKLLTREDGKINWNESAENIERMIRAYDPWPGTWTMWQKNEKKIRLSINSGHVILSGSEGSHGTIFKTPTGFAVQCGKGALEILKLQPEGRRSMTAADFLRGYPVTNFISSP